MRKVSLICSCVLITLALTTSHVFAIEYNVSSPASGMRPINKIKPVERPLMMGQEAMQASRGGAMLENKMATRAGQMSRRAEFKAKLEEISDSNKQTIVEKIDTQITSLNTSQTASWMQALTKMESVLSRISAQAATLKAQGQNTAALETSIANAQTAITTAKAAVNTQASKEYIITITSESALRTNVGSTVSQFKTDSKTTKQTVIAARIAVVKAFAELVKLTGASIEEHASSSGTMHTQ